DGISTQNCHFIPRAVYLDFALFCRQLRFPSTGHPPRLRSIEPELNKLEAEVLEAYRQPGAKDQQRLFNVVNSTLKLASELNEAKRFYGALHQYLEAYRNLCLIKAEAPGPDTLTVLKKKGESLRAQLVSGDSDHSIGLMYWEIARSVLDGVGETDKAEIKESAVILERILPRYFELTEGMKR
ncbi:MAG: hypothetical protein L0229_17100, partial [Blastocatellia bacterium]|nr:hypothetical protein [Blastocatellia bacterium]